jgi:uncharacterized repeat protein (TIGR03803 family)
VLTQSFRFVLLGIVLAGCSPTVGGPPSLSPAPSDKGSSYRPRPQVRDGYSVAYNFKIAGGSIPVAQLLPVNGSLYGITGQGFGNIFQLSGATETVLHWFMQPDGVNPGAQQMALMNGTLYGTTVNGGIHSAGVVFKTTTSGIEHVLYSFRGGADGANPWAGLIANHDVLYGTTHGGNYQSLGTVFKVNVSGTEHVLYNFKGGADGMFPSAAVVYENGALYGTTAAGGRNGKGIVFRVSSAGSERVLYSFKSGADGAYPTAALTPLNGVFYGTTQFGGGSALCRNSEKQIIGCGTVFMVDMSGHERVIYRFKGGRDGAHPTATLIAVNGTLYGTTGSGGLGYSRRYEGGFGTVFKISTSGTKVILHLFSDQPDGAGPESGLTYLSGILYGCTTSGGTSGNGTVYRLLP